MITRLAFVILISFASLGVQAKKKPKPKKLPKYDIDFVMERNGRDVHDIRIYLKNKSYHKKVTDSSFDMSFTSKTIVDFFARKQGKTRSMRIVLCIQEGAVLNNSKKIKNCSFKERLKFQFRPDEQVLIKSKKERGSRYTILIRERPIKKK